MEHLVIGVKSQNTVPTFNPNTFVCKKFFNIAQKKNCKAFGAWIFKMALKRWLYVS